MVRETRLAPPPQTPHRRDVPERSMIPPLHFGHPLPYEVQPRRRRASKRSPRSAFAGFRPLSARVTQDGTTRRWLRTPQQKLRCRKFQRWEILAEMLLPVPAEIIPVRMEKTSVKIRSHPGPRRSSQSLSKNCSGSELLGWWGRQTLPHVGRDTRPPPPGRLTGP